MDLVMALEGTLYMRLKKSTMHRLEISCGDSRSQCKPSAQWASRFDKQGSPLTE
jgi:hypothetical protein